MRSDAERIDALERTVRMLAQTTRDALTAVRNHMHEGRFEPPDHQLTGRIDRALGRLDAALSTLGADDGQSPAGAEGRGGPRGEGVA